MNFEKLSIAFFTLITILLLYVAFMPVVMIDVEIYKMEDGSYIYCATGSLTDPRPPTSVLGQYRRVMKVTARY